MLTARDVAYTFQSIMDPANQSPKRQSFAVVDNVKASGEHTVVFQTKEPFAPLLVNLTVGIVPEEAARAAGEDFGASPIGTGPYRYRSRIPESEVVLKANDQYFQGSPAIGELVFRIVPDDTTRYLELIKGHIDFIQNGIPADMVPVVQNKEQYQVIKTPGTNYEYLAFNLQDPILSDRDVRAAIAHAIDVPAMIESLHRGMARPATGLLPPASWAYEPDVSKYPYDPAKAARLLDRAGYPVGPDGWRFSLTYKTTLGEAARLKSEILQQAFKEVGVKLEVRGFDWSTLFSDIKNGDFQLYSLEWVGVSEPDIYYYVFHSQSLPPNGANRGRYINPDLDRLIEAGRHTLNQQRRRAIYSDIQKIVARDLPYVSLWYPDNIVIMKKDLTGFTPHPDGDLSQLWRMHRSTEK
jgi:peptide/nickel transport system substrate-binding protein